MDGETAVAEGLEWKHLLIQIIIGVSLIFCVFGPLADVIGSLLGKVGVDWGLMRWPLLLVVFDILGFPALIILVLIIDIYAGVGFSAFFSALPLVGGLFSALFDFLKKAMMPAPMSFKIGLPTIQFCQEKACVGLGEAWNFFDAELAVTIGIPDWIPLLLFSIWVIFSIIISLPRILYGLFLLLEKIAVIVHADQVVAIFGQIAQTFAGIFSMIVKTPIVYIIVTIVRILFIVLITLFTVNNLAMGAFMGGILFAIDSIAVGWLLAALVGVIIAIVSAFFLGWLQVFM